LGQSADDVLTDPHCEHNKLFDNRKDPAYGPARLVGVGPRFSDITGIIRRPAPLLGEHTVEVLKELGYSEEKLNALKTDKIIFTST
jgi:crotonobetainyl-CoA:carnitine CoA-transferase CaiB-like acyl-CoA transferase